MKLNLEFYVNERYEILKLLLCNQLRVKNDLIIPLSQQEIADIAHKSKAKTNRLLNELIKDGSIILYQNKRGKYAITDKGYKVLQLIQKNNYKEGE